MKKIGISCVRVVERYGIERGLKICKESGFDAVDYDLGCYRLDGDIYGGSEDSFVDHFTKIRKIADDLELEISQTHGLCCPYRPQKDYSNEDARKHTEKDFHASAILGAPSCVVHFLESTTWDKISPSRMHTECSRMFDDFLPFAEKYKVNIAMETFGAARVKGLRIRDFFADPIEFKKQFDRLDTAYKTICVDTGHTHEAESFWVPAPQDMIRILGSDVGILHLHDNSGHWDDHRLPGEGTIQWGAVFDALDEVGYTGVYNFELNLPYRMMLEEYLHFAGKYLRTFVDRRGDLCG